MNHWVTLLIGGVLGLGLSAGRASAGALDPVQKRIFSFTHANADEVKERLDKVLEGLGQREPAQIDQTKNALILVAPLSRIRVVEELIPVIDQPFTQTVRTRRIMEIQMRLSRHFAGRKKEYDRAVASGQTPPPLPGATPGGAAPSQVASVPEPARASTDWVPAPSAGAPSPLDTASSAPDQPYVPPPPPIQQELVGMRLKGILTNGTVRLAVLHKAEKAYLLKRGQLYESGLYPMKGISGVIQSDRVILTAFRQAPMVLKLYEQPLP